MVDQSQPQAASCSWEKTNTSWGLLDKTGCLVCFRNRHMSQNISWRPICICQNRGLLAQSSAAFDSNGPQVTYSHAHSNALVPLSHRPAQTRAHVSRKFGNPQIVVSKIWLPFKPEKGAHMRTCKHPPSESEPSCCAPSLRQQGPQCGKHHRLELGQGDLLQKPCGCGSKIGCLANGNIRLKPAVPCWLNFAPYPFGIKMSHVQNVS